MEFSGNWLRRAASNTTVLLVSLLFNLPSITLGDVVTPRDTVEKYVNIRSESNASSEVVGELRAGEQVQWVSTIPRWYEVTVADGGKGFVSRVWTKVVDAPAPMEELVAAQPNAVEDIVAEETASEPIDAAAPANVVAAEPVEATSEPVPVDSPDAVAVPAAVPLPELEEVVAPPEFEMVVEAPSPPIEEPMPEEPARSETLVELKGTPDFLTKFTGPSKGGNSRIVDDGTNVGIGTTTPQQALDVNGNIQIHNQSSNLVVLSLRQASGQTGYITHNIAGTLTIGAGSEDRITIDRNGNVGIGVNGPRHPLEMANGAYVTAGGVWTNVSSREKKENIEDLTLPEALAALESLTPVRFDYKREIDDGHVGFIAEDVPDLVASADHRGVNSMDIVAVLTTVVQAQQRRLDELDARLKQQVAISPVD
jgi:hypothetical protein